MFREIFAFELRYQIRQPVFWLSCAIFFLLAFGAVTTDAITIGGAIGSVNRNAPFVVMQLLLVMSVIGVFVTTAFVANPVLRDADHGTESLFLATPVRKRDYLLGRFSGALAIALAVFLPVALAVAVGGMMPWLDAERIGPVQAGPYLYSLLVLVAPNILLMGSISFSLATLTRSILYTYAGIVALFVGYAVASTMLSGLENETLAALLDPFGIGAFSIATKYWTVAERNAQVLGLDGVLLQNRALWLAVALAILALTYLRFTLTLAGTRGARRWSRRRTTSAADDAVAAGITPGATADTPPGIAAGGVPEVGVGTAAGTTPAPAAGTAGRAATAGASGDPGRGVAWRQLLHQTRMEVLGVVRSVPFMVILALGVLNLVGASLTIDQMFGTPVYPVTHLMLQVIQGAFLLFIVIILTLYGGELVWRERSQSMSDVVDALPVPSWVLWAAKLVALVAVVLALLLVAMATGIAIQAFRGYTRFEGGLYLNGLFLGIGVPFVLIAVLALFFQVATNHKYLGFLLMVLYFISGPILSALDLDHYLYRYAESPPAPYSEMNGYGHFVAPQVWFYLYWTFAAVILSGLIHLLWVRGRETGLRMRLRLARRRLTRPVGAVFGIAGIGLLGTGSYVFYNTNILNEYVPGDLREARQVRYERDYKQFEGIAQPRISAVRAAVDIYPERRAVDIRGTYRLVNRSGTPIDSLHLLLDEAIRIRELRVPGASLEHEDAELGYRIYRLASPLAPADSMTLSFDLAVENRGFVNGGSNTRVVHNGTFIDNFSYFPQIGYSRGPELTDPNERRKHGLPPIQRMPPLEDEAARRSNYLTSQADWIDFETTVSTSADQIAIAPGYLQREWEENGRRYFHYEMDAPILGFFAYLSADWAVERDHWNDVAIEVYYHPAHRYNVERMIDAVKKSLDYFTTEFGPYQHRQVRIIEFPRYATFAQSFPNTIPFSESIGFIARLDDEDDIDYVFYVTAHEVAHQWWAHQVIGANMQGSTVLSETLAQYSALMVMEREYGADQMRKFLKYELDGYLRGRGSERIEELPLLRVENQPYIHYRKGSLVMYALKDYIGESTLNSALARYIRDVGFQQPPYTTSREFLSYLREVVPADRASILEDLFETITLYDNRARTATYRRRDDGRYEVRLEVDARKYRADGQGEETEVAIDDWIDIGVFGERVDGGPADGKPLLLEKRRVTGETTVFELVVDEEPRKAGIDPLNKLIDRNPEDNIVRTTPATDD